MVFVLIRLHCWVANPISRSTIANKVVWGRTSTEVKLLSRILLRRTNPVDEEEKAEAEVEAEPRSK
jgi:hypothetical protein